MALLYERRILPRGIRKGTWVSVYGTRSFLRAPLLTQARVIELPLRFIHVAASFSTGERLGHLQVFLKRRQGFGGELLQIRVSTACALLLKL